STYVRPLKGLRRKPVATTSAPLLPRRVPLRVSVALALVWWNASLPPGIPVVAVAAAADQCGVAVVKRVAAAVGPGTSPASTLDPKPPHRMPAARRTCRRLIKVGSRRSARRRMMPSTQAPSARLRRANGACTHREQPPPADRCARDRKYACHRHRQKRKRRPRFQGRLFVIHAGAMRGYVW